MTDQVDKKDEDNSPKVGVSNSFTAGTEVDPQASVDVNKEVSTETTVGGVDLEAHASAEAHAGAGYEVTDTSAAVNAEAVVSVETGASATYGGVTAEAHAGAEAHAEAGAQAGFTDGNAYAQVGAEVGASVEAGTSVSGKIGDVTIKNETTVKAEAGAHAGADVQIGKDGVAGHAGAVAGASVGVENTTSAYDSSGNGGSATGGVSVGAQVGAEVGGGATMKKGVATVGVEGEVALLAGVDVDLSVSVDTKPAQQAVVDTANTVAKETTKVVETVAAPVQNAGNAAVNAGKKAGDAIAKPFKKIKLF